MSKKVLLISMFILILCFLFCGCSFVKGAKRELNTLGIVVGLAIDKCEDDDSKILLTAQIVRNDSVGQNASGQGGSSGDGEGDLGKAYWNVSVTGKNLLEAMRSAINITNRDLYIAQNHVVIISREVAEAGIGKYLDYFFRDQESRYDVDLVISDGKAADVLGVDSHLEELPAQDLYKMIEMRTQSGVSPACSLFDFVRNYKTPCKESIVPVVRVVKPEEKDKKSAYLSVSGGAVFKDDKMVSLLDEKDINGVLWLHGSNEGGIIPVVYDGENASVEILNADGSFEAFFWDNKIEVKANVILKCKLGEYQSGKQVTESILNGIEKACSEKIKDEVRSSFSKLQKLGTDVYGIGEYLYRHDFSAWEKLKGDFDVLYGDIAPKVNVSVHILRTGAVSKAVG